MRCEQQSFYRVCEAAHSCKCFLQQGVGHTVPSVPGCLWSLGTVRYRCVGVNSSFPSLPAENPWDSDAGDEADEQLHSVIYSALTVSTLPTVRTLPTVSTALAVSALSLLRIPDTVEADEKL